jgi:hypothetical protein
MPRGDGTGPGGMGPMTGRAAGFCAGYAAPGYASSWGGRGMGYGFGRGGGWGRGMGRGMGWGWRGYGAGYGAGYGYAPPVYPAAPMTGWYGPASVDKETQLVALRNQADQLTEALSRIEEQVRALEESDTA